MIRNAPWKPPILAALALALVPLTTPARSSTPGDVPGLAAWYDIDSVHRRSRDGEGVDRWPDSSGNGHHLVPAREHRLPLFFTDRLNGKPIVWIDPENCFDVAQPFELDDHTIFVVYASDQPGRVLLRSDTDPARDIVLGAAGRFHQIESGGRRAVSYTRSTPIGTDFAIATLGRVSGKLRAFIDGGQLSSGLDMPAILRVARFFRIRSTEFERVSGQGLRVAEMILYDRYLEDNERANVTAYLAEKFGLRIHSPPAASSATSPEPLPIDDEQTLVRLSSRSDVNLNEEAVTIGWNVVGRMNRPFRFDPDTGDEALHCDQSGKVRLTITISLRTETPDARLRLLILRNGQAYHPEETTSPPFAGQGRQKASVIEFQTEMTLDAGDFIEVVTHRDGAPGRVWLEPGTGFLALERIK
jgi:hypothetical protein